MAVFSIPLATDCSIVAVDSSLLPRLILRRVQGKLSVRWGFWRSQVGLGGSSQLNNIRCKSLMPIMMKADGEQLLGVEEMERGSFSRVMEGVWMARKVAGG